MRACNNRAKKPLIKDMALAALVADSDDGFRARVVRVLAGAGWRVLEAVSVEEALALVNRELIHLAVVRRLVADRDGLHLVRTLRLGRPDLPIILLSGTLSPETHARALEAGVTTVVPDAFVDGHFVSLVKHLVERTPPP